MSTVPNVYSYFPNISLMGDHLKPKHCSIQRKREASEERGRKGRSILADKDGALLQKDVPAPKRLNKLENYQHFLKEMKYIFTAVLRAQSISKPLYIEHQLLPKAKLK